MTIDWSKPVQTRDGRPVEIITTKGREPFPVLGYIGEQVAGTSWTLDGRFFGGDNIEERDLINVPEERELWLNVYDDVNYSCAHGTRRYADLSSACGSRTRLACIHVKYKVGEGLE